VVWRHHPRSTHEMVVRHPNCLAGVSRQDFAVCSAPRCRARKSYSATKRIGTSIHPEEPLLTPDVPLFQILARVPPATLDEIVSARLGPTRVKGNAQPAVFNRQIAMRNPISPPTEEA